MPRSRNIKPSFFKNEDLVELAFEYRLLFIGLWTMADREGRMEDRPKKIKMELFPADNVDIKEGLSSLERFGFLLRYQENGKPYLQIQNFVKHQNPHYKELPSEIPPPPGHQDSGVIVDSKNNELPDVGSTSVQGRAELGSTSVQRQAEVDSTSVQGRPELGSTSVQGRPELGSTSVQGRPKMNQTRSDEGPSATLIPDSLYPETTHHRAHAHVHAHGGAAAATIDVAPEYVVSGGDENEETKDVVSGGDENEKPVNIVWPAAMSEIERRHAQQLLVDVDPGACQEIVDVLAAAMRAGKCRSTLGMLRGVIQRWRSGTFDPGPGLGVAASRERSQKPIQRTPPIPEPDTDTVLREHARRLGIPEADYLARFGRKQA